MEPRQRRILQERVGTLQTFAWGFFLFLAAVYGWLQLVRRNELQRLALQQSVKVRTSPAQRGIIFDRNGYRLVDNKRALHLVIQREDLPLRPEPVEALARGLNTDPEALKRRVQAIRNSGGNRALLLADNLDEAGLAMAERLRARFPFLSIVVAPSRVYLGDELAGHVLGYVGEVTTDAMLKEPGRYQFGEIVGRTGFEAARNEHLKGNDGQRRILVDHLGREVRLYDGKEPNPGRSLFLTLDAGLQKTLADAFAGEQGAAVVLDLRDGGILALHSSPSFDPNIFLGHMDRQQADALFRNPSKPLLNRAIRGRYPPGSTFKLLVALCALEKGIITPESTFTCRGRKTYYDREFRCDGVHGTVDLVQAIAHSCDIYFYELGMRLDVDDIHATAVRYGVTELTGVDLPHEIPSRVPSRDWKARTAKRAIDRKWYAGETISVAIGQGQNGLTPISLARFYAAIATGGKLLTPHLLYAFRNDRTRLPDLVPPPAPRDLGMDPRIWTALDEGLAGVLRYGTARKAALPGIEICGKTGTAQVAEFKDKAHYAKQAKHLKDHSLFAGYAPRENPQIAFAVVAENAGFGADTAAPLARRICQYWFLERPRKPLPPPGGRIPDAFETGPRQAGLRPGEGP
ncbi:MAG: penicillin-binding protein 2 [Acidobacteria bacterium]|nr:penicillin-binding protein 2 [Acidobacteriota bacterium]